MHDFYNQGEKPINYVIKQTCPFVLALAGPDGEGFILFSRPDANQKSQAGRSNQRTGPRFWKPALILGLCQTRYARVIYSLDPISSARQHGWTQLLPKRLFSVSKNPSSEEADRNDGGGSCFKGRPRGSRTGGSQPPPASIPSDPPAMAVAPIHAQASCQQKRKAILSSDKGRRGHR